MTKRVNNVNISIFQDRKKHHKTSFKMKLLEKNLRYIVITFQTFFFFFFIEKVC